MSYIGTKPTSSFSSATSQTFTGNNSTTSFTLNRRVSRPEDLEVFVSNIQQQPTVSYTIGSTGLALNFDSAPPSGEFYVVYRSEAGTSAIDTGAARTANANTFSAAQTFSGGISGTTGSFSGDITGTLGTAAQPNITSTGTLTSFRSTGIDDNANTLAMTISDSSKVGIGTTSPAAQLHIDEGSSNSYGTIRLEGNNRGGDIEMYQGTVPVSTIRTDQSGNMYFKTSGAYGNTSLTTKMSIATAGPVGINTDSPNSNYQLHVYNAAAGSGVFVQGLGAGREAYVTLQGETSGGSTRTALFKVDNSDKIRLACAQATEWTIETADVAAYRMLSDRQQIMSISGDTSPGNNMATLSLGYHLGGNKGGLYMPTYSYYGDIYFEVRNNDTHNGRTHDDIKFNRNGYRHGGIKIIGNSGVSYDSISDYREKTDEKPIDDAIGTVKKLKPYNFKWKKSGKRQDGFFAHEVDELLDYVVTGEKDATKTYEGVVLNKEGNMIASNIKKEDFDKRLDDADDEEASPPGETTYPEGSTWKATHEDIEPQGLDPAKLVPILTAALQEAIKRIEVLESK